MDQEILLNKWKLESVFNINKAEKPGFCIFNNIAYAVDLLYEHIRKDSRICLHTDVDMDGFGSTFIFKRTLENLGSHKHLLLINKDKIHGIQQKHADYFNKNNNIDLMIITDSSSNEINIIKQFNCDVLCIDHHELNHKNLLGYCNDNKHRYVIVNSTIDNYNFDFDKDWLIKKNPKTFENIENYIGTQDMSCGLAVYEILRVYCNSFGHPNLMENLRLYQWASITLFTDVINTLNDRNQYYIDNTLYADELEPTLKIVLNIINSYKIYIDKSFINYSFAPIINKAIRAGAGSEALNIIINNPSKILELHKYAEMQKNVIEKATYKTEIDEETGLRKSYEISFNTPYIMYDIGKLNIHHNYTGVIASRLAGKENKNTAVYIVTDNNTCKGSFRGIYNFVDYRAYFDNFDTTVYAQGHPSAFGFECTYDQLLDIMSNISSIEPSDINKKYITIGNMTADEKGEYHIDNLIEFKQKGLLLGIACGNSKVNSNNEINIIVKASDVTLKDIKGKVFNYNVLGGIENGGMVCKAFKAIDTKYCNIYAEYSREVELFIK